MKRLSQKRHTLLLIVATGCIVAAAITGSVLYAAHKHHKPQPDLASSSLSNSNNIQVGKPFPASKITGSDNTVSNTATASTPPAPKTLLDVSGNGSSQTQSFTTTGNWTVTYSYSSCAGGSGNFAFNVDNVDGTINADVGANELGSSGGSTDYYYDAGQHYLAITSECSWHLIVKGD